MHKKITPNMMVKDINLTLDFYCNILGFDLVIGVIEGTQDIVVERQENQLLAFAIVKSGNVELMFQTEKSLTEEISQLEGTNVGSSTVLYIEVEDVKKVYDELKDKVIVVKDIETKFYGKREFYFRDCNGYILGFAGDI
ncbi:MAG: VOC family protein [Candidatus Omnitrophica bacterium]|nr:VOC family protein [Candidatus Omnitrophota bacterium]